MRMRLALLLVALPALMGFASAQLEFVNVTQAMGATYVHGESLADTPHEKVNPIGGATAHDFNGDEADRSFKGCESWT